MASYMYTADNNTTSYYMMHFKKVHSKFGPLEFVLMRFHCLSVKCDGHQMANVTPYMHIMVYHVPQLMKVHGGIKRFTGQGKFTTYLDHI